MNENISTSCCPICSGRHLHYAFTLEGHRVVSCKDCGFMTINPQPSDEKLASIYGGDYFVLSDSEDGVKHVETLKKSTANRYLDLLLGGEGNDLSNFTLLEIGCGGGDFLSQAAKRGLKVVGLEYSEYACKSARKNVADFGGEIIQGEIDQLGADPKNAGRFDFIVFCDVLEHIRDVNKFLKTVNLLLKPSGTILCVVPSLDSFSAKLMKTKWMEFKLEHLHYFDTKTLRSLLMKMGFCDMTVFPAKKTLSMEYICAHFEKHSIRGWSGMFKFFSKILPDVVLKKPFPITASGIGIIAKKKAENQKLKLSVIMPAYNEASTIEAGIEKVLKKNIENFEIELIIVESNSTDGTREIVKNYSNQQSVLTIFEEKPKGKGHACRAGIAEASGDFVLIQDADDEYDIEDYDSLLEPLRNGSETFVLGARHGGGAWKMREFSDQPVRAFILNCGHWFFTFLVNIFYGVWLRDPFTMYKVFRLDAVKGIKFTANRFDFDYELLILLIRSGHIPIEIPVNYRSRSFAQGKKVRMFADPISWIYAIAKYRFSSIR